jgi:hypothetical protein
LNKNTGKPICRDSTASSAQPWLSFYERYWSERLDTLEAMLHRDKEE